MRGDKLIQNEEPDLGEFLKEKIEELSPSDLTTALFRDRPYDGQPHTDTGLRGKTQVQGVTFRDLRDAFVIGCFRASGLAEEDYPASLYDLPWEHMSPLAVFQNMACEVEKMMGIYPNVPPMEYKCENIN